MAKIVLLDTEQAQLISEGADAISRMLGIRLERADPDKVISNSFELQKLKLDHVKRQLDLPALPDWDGISPERRSAIRSLAKVLSDDTNARFHADAFQRIIGAWISAREEQIRELRAGRDAQGSAKDDTAPKDAGG